MNVTLLDLLLKHFFCQGLGGGLCAPSLGAFHGGHVLHVHVGRGVLRRGRTGSGLLQRSFRRPAGVALGSVQSLPSTLTQDPGWRRFRGGANRIRSHLRARGG